MKDLNQHTDDLFRQGFSGHEASFDPAAWEHMQTLLDKEDDLKPVLFVHDNTTKKRKQLIILIITIMSLLTLLSISSMLFNNHSNTASTPTLLAKASTSENTTVVARGKDVTKTPAIQPGNKSTLKKPSATKKTAIVKSHQAAAKIQAKPENSGSNTVETGISEGITQAPVKVLKDTFLTAVKNGKVYKVLSRTTWVPEEYDWVVDNSQKTVTDGFIGIHFTGQRNRGADTGSAGFNLQFMSGNRLSNPYWGLYGGVDWGMQFYGKSKKSNVALNNTRGDSGFARLRSHSMDFLGRGHLEYARYALIPYVNVMAGPRIYATNQQVASYVQLKETESSTSNNVHTSVSMLYGFGAGLRLRISPVVSLDARYEWINGSKVKQVDLSNSTFNGLNHELKYYSSKPRQEQFKFGILIDISETQYEKKLIKEGYYKVTTIDSLQIDPKDSNKIYLPCNCGPCPGNSNVNYPGSKESDEVIVYPRTREYKQEDNSSEPRTRTNSNSNSSSGSKGSFPGIRPPAPKPVNPN